MGKRGPISLRGRGGSFGSGLRPGEVRNTITANRTIAAVTIGDGRDWRTFKSTPFQQHHGNAMNMPTRKAITPMHIISGPIVRLSLIYPRGVAPVVPAL
jgi:hypothetical protein